MKQFVNQCESYQFRKRVANEEYRVEQRGQATLNQENEILIQKEQKPKRTKFETEKEKIHQEQHGIQVKKSRGRWSYLPLGRTKPIIGRKQRDIFEKEAILEAVQRERTVPETVAYLLGVQKENALISVHGGRKLEVKTQDDLTIENRTERSDLSGH